MSCPAPNPPPVVIDNGSWSVKAGFAADKTPRIELPSKGAIQEGLVTQWDAMTEVELFMSVNSMRSCMYQTNKYA